MSKLRRQMSANTASVVETKSLIDIKAKTGNLYESIAYFLSLCSKTPEPDTITFAPA